MEGWRFLIGNVSLSLVRLRTGRHSANSVFSGDMKGERKKERTQSGGNVIFNSRLVKSSFTHRLKHADRIPVLFNGLIQTDLRRTRENTKKENSHYSRFGFA